MTEEKRIKPMQGMDGNKKKINMYIGTYTHNYKAREKATLNIYYTLSTTCCLLL